MLWSLIISNASLSPAARACADTRGSTEAPCAPIAATASSAISVAGSECMVVRISRSELLIENAVLEIVFRIEQQGDGLFARLADHHLDHVAHFVGIRRRADRPLVVIENVE